MEELNARVAPQHVPIRLIGQGWHYAPNSAALAPANLGCLDRQSLNLGVGEPAVDDKVPCSRKNRLRTEEHRRERAGRFQG